MAMTIAQRLDLENELLAANKQLVDAKASFDEDAIDKAQARVTAAEKALALALQ